MAANDNVRVLYKDGLILGADELSDDQSYFRAALERRRLASEMFGIAFGLELEQQGELVRLNPGIAWDGNGKAIVVRLPEDISGKLVGKPDGDYAVFISFVENGDSNKNRYSFCGTAMDPRIEEAYRIEVSAPPPAPLPEGMHGGSRRAPQSALPAPNEPDKSRILLGIVQLAVQADGSQKFTLLPTTPRVPSEAQVLPASADRAEYAGTVTSALIHPRHWTGAGKVSQIGAGVAIELDADSGVHFYQPSVLHRALYISGEPKSFKLSTDGNALALDVCPPASAAPTPILTADESKLVAQGNLEVKKDLTVEKEATVQGLLTAAGGLSAGGTTTLGKLKTTDDLDVGGKLSVTSSASLKAGLECTGATSLAKGTDPGTGLPYELTVEGTAHFKKIVTFDAGANGLAFNNLSCTTLVVSGTTSMGGALTCGSDIVVNGAGSLKVNAAGGLLVAGAAGAQITGTGGLQVNATAGLQVIGPASVSGKTTLDDVLTVSQPIVARGGVVIEVNVPAGAAVGMAVIPAGTITAGRTDVSLAPAAAASTQVLGILTAISGTQALAIVSGFAQALVPAGTNAGDWLASGGAAAGGLASLGGVAPAPGTGLAKALTSTIAASLAPVLVCLG